MWVHMMSMGGCGRAACPSNCTKQGLVKTLWYRTRLSQTHTKAYVLHKLRTCNFPVLSRSLLTHINAQIFSDLHKEANNMGCKIMKYLRLHRYTHFHTSPGGTTSASDADPIPYICICLSSIYPGPCEQTGTLRL